MFSATREHKDGIASNRSSACYGENYPSFVHTARHTKEKDFFENNQYKDLTINKKKW